MDIIGLGTEIVECVRVRQLIDRHAELFLNRVFTDQEVRNCHECRNATEQFAGRWAVKCAVIKSLGQMARGRSTFREIEVEQSRRGAVTVRLVGTARMEAERLGVLEFHVSMALTRNYTTAVVVAMGHQRDTSTTS